MNRKTAAVVCGVPPDRRGRRAAYDWASLPVGWGHPASSGMAYHLNKRFPDRHFVTRKVDGVTHCFRQRRIAGKAS